MKLKKECDYFDTGTIFEKSHKKQWVDRKRIFPEYRYALFHSAHHAERRKDWQCCCGQCDKNM